MKLSSNELRRFAEKNLSVKLAEVFLPLTLGDENGESTTVREVALSLGLRAPTVYTRYQRAVERMDALYPGWQAAVARGIVETWDAEKPPREWVTVPVKRGGAVRDAKDPTATLGMERGRAA